MALIGPCIVAAPVVGVLAILAIPLWPIAILLVGLARILFWPVERMATATGASWGREWSTRLAAALALVLRPWSFFDPPE